MNKRFIKAARGQWAREYLESTRLGLAVGLAYLQHARDADQGVTLHARYIGLYELSLSEEWRLENSHDGLRDAWLYIHALEDYIGVVTDGVVFTIRGVRYRIEPT